jgi:calcium-dependent protein kinase
VGSIAYLSPEILNAYPYDHRTDIWSMGIVLYTLLSGHLPFVQVSVEQTVYNIKYKNISFDQSFWDGISSAAKDLVSRLLTKDPTYRISLEEALQHSWLQHPAPGGSAGPAPPSSNQQVEA